MIIFEKVSAGANVEGWMIAGIESHEEAFVGGIFIRCFAAFYVSKIIRGVVR